VVDAQADVRTLLFTDIVGSTRLWEDHPDAMREALGRHNDLLREIIEAEGGLIFKTMGDAFCASFSDALAASRAAVRAQIRLAAVHWPDPIAITVRMGLHTGACVERDGDYFGPVVNRVARLEAVAHGGQVVLSEATALVLSPVLDPGVELVDLGFHRLKDLDRPEHVFQLASLELAAEFPPLRSLENPDLPNNLPEQTSSFIGRHEELAVIRQLMGHARLVTLVGTGGAGKTRLALAMAAELLDGSGSGVWSVELASIADPDLVVSAIALSLGLREEPRRSLLDTVTAAIGDRPALLLLDNCEHLIGAVANVVDQLLGVCPRVRLLATSRQPLAVSAERVYRVPSLSLPSEGDAEDVLEGDAVQLFLDRAQQYEPNFVLDATSGPLVVDLCRRLDGIPLAIELAAVQLHRLSLAEVHRRLDDRFRLLDGGTQSVLPRQKTLRAAVDWSYDLLEDAEAMMLCQLSVFAGGFTIDAAEAIFSGEAFEAVDVVGHLASLSDKSLVHPDGSERNRYRLHETIRQYAGERLVELGALARHAARDAHATVFLHLAEEAAPHLVGREQKAWLERLEIERDNLRLAVGYFLSVPSRHEQALRMGIALRRLWVARGHWAEGSELLRAALELPGAHAPRRLRAAALCAAGQMCARRSEHLDAEASYEEALQIGRAINDETIIAESLAGLAWAALSTGHQREAKPLADEAVVHARLAGERGQLGLVLERRASVNYDALEVCQADYAEALECLREVEDLYSIGIVENNIGDLELLLGHPEEARAHIEVAIAISHELDDTSVVYCYLNLASAKLLSGDLDGARRSYLDALRGARRAGDQFIVANAVLGFSLCESADGRDEAAAELHGVADGLLSQLGAVLEVGEARLRADDQNALRARMGDARFAAAYEAGGALTPGDGIARAVASASPVAVAGNSGGAATP
jgi:predicted ATPase/class 3 adenylate cyclase